VGNCIRESQGIHGALGIRKLLRGGIAERVWDVFAFFEQIARCLFVDNEYLM
jgi:hypothetical protein